MFKKFLRILMLTALLVYSWSSVRPVSAETDGTTFTVDCNGDTGDAQKGDGFCATASGSCTLRAAVEEAIALPGPQTIIIPAMTIYLSADLRLTTTYDNYVSQDVSVTIQGAGEGKTIIDGNNRTRAFYFGNNSGTHSISNLTIRNANNKNTGELARNGGGIFNQGILTLNDVTITNSRAFEGGGIYNEYDRMQQGIPAPKLVLNHVKLISNVASSSTVGFGGGGLFNGGILQGDDVTISYNYAELQGGGFYNNTYHASYLKNFTISNNTSRFGGGINNDLASSTPDQALLLENGTISGNVANCCNPVNGAATGGGGIYHNMGYMKLVNVAITDNVVPTNVKVGGYGGGITNIQYMELENVSISGNQATYGAGIYNGNAVAWPNQLNMVNVTISGNLGPDTFPDSEGGGIFNTNYGKIHMINATITDNQADVTGGVKNHSSLGTLIEFKNTILAGNKDSYKAEDCRGTLVSLGYNIVNNYLGNTKKGMPCNINPQASDQLGIVPLLGPLTGSPGYHVLLPGSEAIDRGTIDQCPSTDMRGSIRPQGPTCDVGSYEWENVPVGPYQIFLPMAVKDGQ